MNYSIHEFVGFKGSLYKNNWGVTSEPLEDVIVKDCWSPAVWFTGTRLKNHFAYADLAAFDFDNSWSISEAIDWAKFIGAWCVIGTTKSHRVGNDCFRLVFRWNERIADLKQFEQNQSRFIDATPADPACRDGARFYYPCREIVYRQDGRPITVLPYKPASSPPPSRPARIPEGKQIPPWMATELEQGVPEGKRNRSAFRFALHLRERGFSQDETEHILSAITIPASELSKCVWSAWKQGPRRGARSGC